MTVAKLYQLIGRHRQQRNTSCFQSAVEMALKLHRIIRWADYPEQNITANDGRGYEPFQQPKSYNGKTVSFRQQTFAAPYTHLVSTLHREIAARRFPILSLRPVGLQGWHGYIATHVLSSGDVLLFSKCGLAERDTEVTNLLPRLVTQEKVDCLFYDLS